MHCPDLRVFKSNISVTDFSFFKTYFITYLLVKNKEKSKRVGSFSYIFIEKSKKQHITFNIITDYCLIKEYSTIYCRTNTDFKSD
jgi:hypothetical protein